MRSILFTLFLLVTFLSSSQINDIEFAEKKGLVTSEAFNEVVKEDFGYLIFNNFTPEQGASITAKETDTKLQVSLKVFESNYGIFTTSISANASDGVYFFDEDQGQSAQINANYFKFFKPSYKYYEPEDKDKNGFRKVVYDSLSIPKKTLEKIQTELINEQKLKKDTALYKSYLKQINKSLNHLKYLSSIYINSDKSIGFSKLKPEKAIKIDIHDKNGDLSNLKIAGELNKVVAKTDKIKKMFIGLEKMLAKKAWKTKRLWFISAHATYQRESFNRFIPNSTLSFNQQFALQTGDIFSSRIYGSYFQQRISPEKYKYIPKIIVFRPFMEFGRISNRINFSEITINSNEIISNTTSTNQSRTAYIGENSYEYGNSIQIGVEAYLFPVNYNFGFFAQIGHQWNHFSRLKNVKNKELTPFRAGILVGFKGKNKKPAVTAQFFIDRTDFSLAPNGNDSDLRVGLSLGIPFKF
ncbi:hypothetical protein LY01_01646 [Nonlabens xylanidelens]|uniref:Outer membrane protein with beta-barrel domain n=1 Tax=Nonlabens xylanidelens TaxID=191564 RepID=A0A2S6IKY5_9FLAO|nr:hypothetical protein [Nonlabens xylanidelens]PPK94893.1 hypothetical protein LY01_01646 [Nonlabens xylanidelens]PQJ17441.1 hypothetical protein BST94_10300 [Nonlabens xylanidelens]